MNSQAGTTWAGARRSGAGARRSGAGARRLGMAAVALTALSLGGCAGMVKGTPFASAQQPYDHTTLADRMNAEEAGYTSAFVDVILSACQAAQSAGGRAFLRRDRMTDTSGSLRDSVAAAALEKRLVRVGPTTVKPVFRSVREFSVPLLATPAITERHVLADAVIAPEVYGPLHGEVISLMRMVDAVKAKGNKASTAEVAAIVGQANVVCEQNAPVVDTVMARAVVPDEAVEPIRVALVAAPEARVASADKIDGAMEALLQPVASTAPVPQARPAKAAESVSLPETTRFVTVTLDQDRFLTARSRVRLFAPRAPMTLDLPRGAQATVTTGEALESLVIVR